MSHHKQIPKHKLDENVSYVKKKKACKTVSMLTVIRITQ